MELKFKINLRKNSNIHTKNKTCQNLIWHLFYGYVGNFQNN